MPVMKAKGLKQKLFIIVQSKEKSQNWIFYQNYII